MQILRNSGCLKAFIIESNKQDITHETLFGNNKRLETERLPSYTEAIILKFCTGVFSAEVTQSAQR